MQPVHFLGREPGRAFIGKQAPPYLHFDRCEFDDPVRLVRKIGIDRARLKRAEGFAVQTIRSASIFLISAIARAGLNPLGQALEQFMMVWQR